MGKYSYVSEPILAEYEDVLRRPRLAINLDKVKVALARIRAAALLVQPVAASQPRLTPMTMSFLNARTPHKLECAETAQARCKVTG
jgi:hypothetical protein